MNDTEAQDGGGGDLHGLRPGVLRIIVCVAGTCVGAFFGSFDYPLGTLLGAVGGFAAGLVWTRVMLRRARAGFSRGRLVNAGTGWGIVVGLLATAILWGGLFIRGVAQGHVTGGGVLGALATIGMIAIICAVVGGSITGAVCGCFVPLKSKPD